MRDQRVIPRQIRYLLAVAEHRNFTRAAEALGVSQPALSQQIRQWEEDLGASLFDRSGRSVNITDAGELYLRHAQNALQELRLGQQALMELNGLGRGVLRIACTPSFTESLIPRWVQLFYDRYPQIRIEVTEMPLDAIEAALYSDQVDVAVGFKDVAADDILVTPLFDERLSLITGQQSALAQRRAPISAAELAALPLALLSESFAARAYADSYFRDHHIEPTVVFEANSLNAVLAIVRQGQFCSVLPLLDGETLHGTHAVPLAAPVNSRTAALLQKAKGHQTAASLAFARLIRESLHP